MVVIDHNVLATAEIEHRLENTTLLICVVLTALKVNSVSIFTITYFWPFRRNSLQYILESCSCCSEQVHLYALTPSTLRWPVLSIINCSSMPFWKSLVAAVTLRE